MSNTFIKIVDGTYGKKAGKPISIAGTIFPMVKAFQTDKQGGYVTVDAMRVPNFPGRTIKVRCESPKSYEFVNESDFDKSIKHIDANVPGETEQQAIERAGANTHGEDVCCSVVTSACA